MGGGSFPPIPDYRKYRVEDVPELMKVKKNLAELGLHDPWLRNEVWKFPTKRHRFPRLMVFKQWVLFGMKYGLIAGAVTACIEWTFFPLRTLPDEGHASH